MSDMTIMCGAAGCATYTRGQAPTGDEFHKVGNWCSLTDAAERAGRNERTIRRWIKAEEVRSKRVYQQVWVFWPDVAAREARR